MDYVSISAATEALRKVANHETDHVLVMRDNRPAAVVLSPEHYRALTQLRELLRDPEAFDEMLRVHRAAMQGRADGPTLEDYAAARAAGAPAGAGD